jgi:bifunctional enzyme CysN/CysC
VSQQLEAMVVWLSETPLAIGKEYLIKHTTRLAAARVSTLRYGIDVNTLRRQQQPTLELNQIGRCEITTPQPLFHDPYDRNRHTGAFILIDRITNGTVAAGMILDRSAGPKAAWDETPSDTLQAAASPVSAEERAARLGQEPVTVLFTGLAGSGKSSVAHAVERALFDRGRLAMVLDGQNFRLGLSKDLGFSAADRAENLRRFAEVARLVNQSGLIVLGAFVAPSEEYRVRAADEIGRERFLTVHVDCPVEVCRRRLPGDLYARADAGELPDFPGVTSAYERPTEADLTLDTQTLSVADAAKRVLALLTERGFLT